MTPTAAGVRRALRAEARPEKVAAVAGYFKTGKGQYGEGDRFLGVSVPAQRRIARAHRALALGEVEKLLASKVHEERLTALLALVARYQRGDAGEQQRCHDFYLSHLGAVNNWDLVDTSAPTVVGQHLRTRDRRVLYRLARSQNLWERRVAMLATYAFITAGESKDALALAALLLGDDHDLIHKAVGWMLREVGKRVSLADLRGFLRQHAATMPRTALRYAIERLPEPERRAWLAKRPAPRGSRRRGAAR